MKKCSDFLDKRTKKHAFNSAIKEEVKDSRAKTKTCRERRKQNINNLKKCKDLVAKQKCAHVCDGKGFVYKYGQLMLL